MDNNNFYNILNMLIMHVVYNALPSIIAIANDDMQEWFKNTR